MAGSPATGEYAINYELKTVLFNGLDVNDPNFVLTYLSNSLTTDESAAIPKLAEEALYASILHYIVSTRANQPEYLVQRLRRDKSSKLRNAKIRLSNIKLTEIVQVMRGKSKWLKH